MTKEVIIYTAFNAKKGMTIINIVDESGHQTPLIETGVTLTLRSLLLQLTRYVNGLPLGDYKITIRAFSNRNLKVILDKINHLFFSLDHITCDDKTRTRLVNNTFVNSYKGTSRRIKSYDEACALAMSVGRFWKEKNKVTFDYQFANDIVSKVTWTYIKE